MAKKWYPIIDKDKCTKCLSCVNFCKHDVYSTNEEGFPLVKKPDNCVEFCRGCQKICPAETITYFGDKK